LDVMMSWTGTFIGKVRIGDRSSETRRTLTPEDLEFMLDSMADSLAMMAGVNNISVGGTLASGDIEVTFSMLAASLTEAHAAIFNAFGLANTYAAMAVTARVGATERVDTGWQSSRVDPSELVPA